MRIIFASFIILPLIIGTALSVNSRVPKATVSTQVPLTKNQAKTVDKLLGGKAAGEPVQCLDSFRNKNPIRIGNDFLLYRVNANLVYRNELRGSCRLLTNKDYIMVVQSPNGGRGHCNGDQFQMLNRFNGILGPVCAFGEFVPYTTVKNDSQDNKKL
jgi:hypothetical protein